MKKSIFAGALISLLIFALPADELANRLHDLAVQTACVGVYTKAKINTNVNSRNNDPPDFYTPSMLTNRFTAISMNSTRTNVFYGVCFDYAQFAWYEIKKNQKKFNDAGMKGTEWYIAIANAGNPNVIILYDPVSKDNATITYNSGVSLKEILRYNVYAHDGTSNHAWIWVKHNNGKWYWVDPTWTDNTGYVRWGIVENGREVQYNPIPSYCVASYYPGASRTYIASNTATRSPGTVPSTRPDTSKASYISDDFSYFEIGYNYSFGLPVGFTIGFGIPVNLFLDRCLFYNTANFNSFTDIEITQFEWVFGVSIEITNWLRIPVGIGANHAKIYYPTYDGPIYGEKGGSYFEHKFVIEVGLQPVILDLFYLSGSYRLKNFSESGFSIGAGLIF